MWTSFIHSKKSAISCGTKPRNLPTPGYKIRILSSWSVQGIMLVWLPNPQVTEKLYLPLLYMVNPSQISALFDLLWLHPKVLKLKHFCCVQCLREGKCSYPSCYLYLRSWQMALLKQEGREGLQLFTFSKLNRWLILVSLTAATYLISTFGICWTVNTNSEWNVPPKVAGAALLLEMFQ